MINVGSKDHCCGFAVAYSLGLRRVCLDHKWAQL
jgi:hypothetical protein